MSYIEKCDMVTGPNGTAVILDDSFERSIEREAEMRSPFVWEAEARTKMGRPDPYSDVQRTKSFSRSSQSSRQRSILRSNKRKVPRLYSFSSARHDTASLMTTSSQESKPSRTTSFGYSSSSRSATLHRTDTWPRRYEPTRLDRVKTRTKEATKTAGEVALKCVSIPAVVVCDLLGSIFS